HGPDLLRLATDLAGIGGTELPLEVSAIDSYPSATDPPERSLTIIARVEVRLAKLFTGQEQLCDVLDRCADVSPHRLARAPSWLGEDHFCPPPDRGRRLRPRRPRHARRRPTLPPTRRRRRPGRGRSGA